MIKILNLTLLATTLLLFGCVSNNRYLVTDSNFRNKAEVRIKNIEYVTGKCIQGHTDVFPPAGKKFCLGKILKDGSHYAAIAPVDAIKVTIKLTSMYSIDKKDELFYLTAAEVCSQLRYMYLVKTVESTYSSHSEYTSLDEHGSVINGQYYGSVTRNVNHMSMNLYVEEFIFFSDPDLLSVGLFERNKVSQFSNDIMPCIELYDPLDKFESEQSPSINDSQTYSTREVMKEAWKNFYPAKELASELRTELKLPDYPISYEIKSDIEKEMQSNKEEEQSALERLKQD